MADQGNALTTTRAPSELQLLRVDLEKRAGEIKMALPQGIAAEKFQRTIITAAQQNPELLKADRRSLILACMKAAQDGLLPDGREAALVIYKTRTKRPKQGGGTEWVSISSVQYIPMVYGLRKKILQASDADGTPIVSALSVNVVYAAEVENGYFRWEVGSDPEVSHAPMLSLTEEEAKDENIVAAYSIVTMHDGTKAYDVLRRFQIDKIRECSQTGATGRIAKYDMGDIKKGQPIPPKGPWVDWFPEMAMKTVMRHHSKTLPMSGDVIMDRGDDRDEIDANLSTAAVLGSTAGGEPELLTDETDGSTYDGATGEVVEDADEPAKPKRASRAKAKADEPKPADAEPAGCGGHTRSPTDAEVRSGQDRAGFG
jgi:recombination protein RecT